MSDLCTVWLTQPDTTTAEDIAEALVLRNLAAVVTIVPEVKTVRASRKHEYKVKPEVLMMIKTQSNKLDRLMEFVKLNTPYNEDKMDITSVPIGKGNDPFLNWMMERMTETVDIVEHGGD